jgi:hypothetical protein
MRDEPGPWAMASSWRMGQQNWFLFEDHGLMVVLQSQSTPKEYLADYARRAAGKLRADRPIRSSSSSAAASPSG